MSAMQTITKHEGQKYHALNLQHWNIIYLKTVTVTAKITPK